jgi:hypothetical protein
VTPIRNNRVKRESNSDKRTLQKDRNRAGTLAFRRLGSLLLRNVVINNFRRVGGHRTPAAHAAALRSQRARETHAGQSLS